MSVSMISGTGSKVAVAESASALSCNIGSPTGAGVVLTLNFFCSSIALPYGAMGKGKGKGAKKGTSSWPDGFAGVSSNGLFGTSAAWVDVAKAPGHTSQEKTLGLEKTAKSIATLSHMFWSPNLVWFAMACAYHVLFPYDIEAARRSGFVSSSDGGSWAISGWVLSRFYLNYCVALAYYGYFYAQLYVAGAAARLQHARKTLTGETCL